MLPSMSLPPKFKSVESLLLTLERRGSSNGRPAEQVADGEGRRGGELMRWRGRADLGRGGRVDLGRGERVDLGRGGRVDLGRGRGRGPIRGVWEETNGAGGRGRRGREEDAMRGHRTEDRQRGGGARGRNGEQGTAKREGAGMGVRRGGHSMDRRRGERRDGAAGRQNGNNGRSHSTDRAGASHGPRLGYKSLQELSSQDPSLVAISLSTHPAFPEVLSDSTMRKDLIELLCEVISKAFKSRTDRSTQQRLANIIKESQFFQVVLLMNINSMSLESNEARRARYPQQLDNILTILSKVFSNFPAGTIETVSLLLTVIQASINTLRASGVDIQPQVERSLESLQEQVQPMQEKSREGTLRSDKDTYALLNTAGDEDQEDFRTIPIYPTREEFHQDHRPFLRPNLTSQRYTSSHLYLDTHFRLLREDFVRPLREGIQELLREQKDMGRNDKPLKSKRFDDIRIYFDTKVMVPQCTNSGLAYLVQFDIQPLKFVRWQNSKRLIYGSLVCLSYDDFESFLFATVSDRDPKYLEKGLVQITFTEESRLKLASIQKDQTFLMVETTAYFEAYRYVLEGLQEQEEDNLPFKRYIVDCNKEVKPPAYLQWTDVYNLSSIAEPDIKGSVRPFHTLDDKAWPTMEKLGLDKSQMEALKLAITKELAIIQGPPGTGKTHVGLKIAQALLRNQELWTDDGHTAPMLVVCYTNHALDQFLEGIYKFLHTGIVRVGGRSNSEILKRFNLRELTHGPNFRRTLPSQLRSAFSQIYKELCEIQGDIQNQSMKLEVTLKGVLRENVLQRFISEQHWTSLHQCPKEDDFEVFYNEKKTSVMMEWLGLGTTVFQQRETENANGNDEDEEMESEEEDLIEIAEEADLIQAERIIEDGPRGGRDDRKKSEMKQAVREAEKHMLAMNLDAAVKTDEQSEEGFKMQKKQKKKMKYKIRKELAKSSAMTEQEEFIVYNVWSLSLQDRWRLYRLWVGRYRDELRARVLDTEQEYQNAADRLADVKQRENLCVLKNAKVIGMTTTGAAKYRTMLQEVQPRLVIVEEAAEVLEAHTITTLSPMCQHLILIGDHQQLRPSATVYDLAKNFNLELSMFERLVKMGLPYVRLNYQHRMRPEIARLLTPHIYSELQNHPSVLDYENIKGLKTNLFFVEHNQPEEQIKDGKSHQNRHEAEFVVALCRYFLLQGYKPEQITILTTYTGQLYCLRNLMPASQFSGVKVHVVDKYQGEENDIVLLSLVRSNAQGKVGFLSIANRVCVALSRAKKGLYCIGNSLILGHVKLWSDIFHTLRDKNQMGKTLTLCCQNHPERQVNASCADDFKRAPEGGCEQPCLFRLDCGHVCTRACHPYDAEHKEFKCVKPCEKLLCDLGHKCPLVCFKKCPEKCTVKVQKIIPQCGHTQMVPCHQDPGTFSCRELCQKTLPCGHPCDSACSELCTVSCKVKVNLMLNCGHSQKDACHYKSQPEKLQCRTPCRRQLMCGHTCHGTCGKCFQGRLHSPCFHKCERLLICSHKCMEPCTRNCPPCGRGCQNFCHHSKCMKPCGQPCAPCVEPCIWECPHLKCSKLCHEPCDRPPCTQACDKTLKCGHPCIGLCGDKCPDKCRICHKDEVTEIFFGTEDDPEACFIQLEDCKHIIEYTAMDKYMGDDNEEAIKLKQCPKCRTPIRKNLRYGSHINRSLAEIEKVKAKINGNQDEIEEHRKAIQKKWEEYLNLYPKLMKYRQISDRLENCYLTANDLWIVENRMEFLVKVEKLLQLERENILIMHDYKFEKNVEKFVEWINDRHQKFTEQQVFDLERELKRLTLLCQLLVQCHVADMRKESDKIKYEEQKLREVLEKPGQFSEQDELIANQVMKELNDKLPLKGLGISDEERKMIVSAMNMRLGHWYKCPNGHVYVITECGGAMEKRQCPDCDAVIGGGSHTLAEGNQVASEMDGATHAAWSEANNILNFEHFIH